MLCYKFLLSIATICCISSIFHPTRLLYPTPYIRLLPSQKNLTSHTCKSHNVQWRKLKFLKYCYAQHSKFVLWQHWKATAANSNATKAHIASTLALFFVFGDLLQLCEIFIFEIFIFSSTYFRCMLWNAFGL